MTHRHSILQKATLCSLVTGILMIFSQGSQAPLSAELTGQGSTMEIQTGIVAMHGAAEIAAARSDAGVQLAMGALFILLGFFLHALMRHRDERNVHITIAPKRPQVRKPTKIDQREWFWVHLHV